MSKTTSKTAPTAKPTCPGCADKAGPCTDCTGNASLTNEGDIADATPTPSAGGRYMRNADGTLTPIEE